MKIIAGYLVMSPLFQRFPKRIIPIPNQSVIFVGSSSAPRRTAFASILAALMSSLI
jgi:hypothetical protein